MVLLPPSPPRPPYLTAKQELPQPWMCYFGFSLPGWYLLLFSVHLLYTTRPDSHQSCSKIFCSQVGWSRTVVRALERQRQADLCVPFPGLYIKQVPGQPRLHNESLPASKQKQVHASSDLYVTSYVNDELKCQCACWAFRSLILSNVFWTFQPQKLVPEFWFWLSDNL